MTRIVGMETFLLEPQLLAAALQRRFAAAAGANPLPGAKAGSACEVVVQGDVAAKVRWSAAIGMKSAWVDSAVLTKDTEHMAIALLHECRRGLCALLY